MGSWLQKNKQAIYGSQPSQIGSFDWGRSSTQLTKNGLAIYLMVFNLPNNNELSIPLIKNEIDNISVLETGVTCNYHKDESKILISIPTSAPNNKVSVIKLLLKGDRVIL